MATIRKRKASSKTKSRSPVCYKAGDVIYSSKDIADFHKSLIGNPVVQSFHLMSAKEEKTYNSGRYKHKKCIINDIQFDSLMEARYYVYLLEQKSFGFIKDFAMQVRYTLMEKYKNKFTNKTIRPIEYLADFVVQKLDGTIEAIDVKGQETDVFKIKQKLFGYKYPDIKLTCYQWSNKYGNRWIDLDELKKLQKESKAKKKKAS